MKLMNNTQKFISPSRSFFQIQKSNYKKIINKTKIQNRTKSKSKLFIIVLHHQNPIILIQNRNPDQSSKPPTNTNRNPETKIKPRSNKTVNSRSKIRKQKRKRRRRKIAKQSERKEEKKFIIKNAKRS